MTTKAKADEAVQPKPPAEAKAPTAGKPTTETPEEVAADVQRQAAAARARMSPETVADRPALADPAALKREAKDGMCAVDDGSPHYADGRAIPGTKVCSAHEVNYHRDGTPRGA